jgi:hypothetical protein
LRPADISARSQSEVQKAALDVTHARDPAHVPNDGLTALE